jgi:amidase
VLSRSVRDSAAVLDSIAGTAPGDPYSAPTPERPYVDELEADPGRLKIGLQISAPGGQFQPHRDCVDAVEATAKLLESLGHYVESSYPDAIDDPDYTQSFIQRWTAGIAWSLDHWSRKTGRRVDAGSVEGATWALAEMGRSIGGPEYLAALEYQQRTARRAAEWWSGGFDLLLSPTMGEPPTLLGVFADCPDNPAAPLFRSIPTAGFTAFWNATGQPAISLPLSLNKDGLPIGIQLVAAYGREDLLIRVAAQLERTQPWADRWPSLCR